MSTGQSQSEIVQRILAQRGLSDAQMTLAGAIGRVESGSGSAMRNPRSSATGYFQFLNGTYQEQLAAIRQRDPATAAEMQRLGKDHPISQAHAYAEYATNSEQVLRQALGRDPTATDMYAAHFFGAAGASQVLRAPGNTPVASLVSADVMNSNPHLRGMTVDGFRQYYEQRLSVGADIAGFVFSNPTLNPIEPEARAAALQGLRDSGRLEDAARLERELADSSPARSAALSELQRIQQELLRAGSVEPDNNNLHLAQKFGAPAAIRIAKNQDPAKRISELGVTSEAYGAYQKESTRLLSNDAITSLSLTDEQRTRLQAALSKPHQEATADDLRVVAGARGQLHEKQVTQLRSRVGSYRGGRAATAEEEAEENSQKNTLDSLMTKAMSNPLMMLMMLIMMVIAPQMMQNMFPGMGQEQGAQDGQRPAAETPPPVAPPAAARPAPTPQPAPAPAPVPAPQAPAAPPAPAPAPAAATPASPPPAAPDERASLPLHERFASLLPGGVQDVGFDVQDIPGGSFTASAPTMGGGARGIG